MLDMLVTTEQKKDDDRERGAAFCLSVAVKAFPGIEWNQSNQSATGRMYGTSSVDRRPEFEPEAIRGDETKKQRGKKAKNKLKMRTIYHIA
jgi:hypothetical protein